jgi:hypothetical protein
MVFTRLTMTGSRPTALLSALFFHLACALVLPTAHSQTLDNGIDPRNLGKGGWIYVLNSATNRLGGNVPGVTSIPSLMSYYRNLGMQFIVTKAGNGPTNFNNNQFDSNLVAAAHLAGLKIFGYTRSYGTDIPGEIDLACRVYDLGADGFVIDAEAEWESSHLGNRGPALALQLCQGIKARYPKKFLAHAPFPIISFHPTFPYKEFGFYCDAVMPQAYWKKIGVSPASMVFWMDKEWRNWQNSLTGIYTNAIKPIAPVAQAWNPSKTVITTRTEIMEYVNALKTDLNPPGKDGYKGVSFWRADLHTNDMWAAIADVSIGNPVALVLVGQTQTVVRITSSVTNAGGFNSTHVSSTVSNSLASSVSSNLLPAAAEPKNLPPATMHNVATTLISKELAPVVPVGANRLSTNQTVSLPALKLGTNAPSQVSSMPGTNLPAQVIRLPNPGMRAVE